MKIYLSPSAQPANVYASENTNEQIQCNRIASYCETALRRCGIEAKKAPEGQDYRRSVEESNAWGADLHVPIHTNAGGGAGPVVFIYDLSPARLSAARPVYEALRAIAPTPGSYGLRADSGLYELAATRALCLYCECEFHDSPALAQWIVTHARDIGEALCLGLCRSSGLPYVPPSAPAQAPTLDSRLAALEKRVSALEARIKA